MIQQRNFYAMGCNMMAALDSESASAQKRLAQAPIWFEIWEAALSRFRPDSELMRVNRHAGAKQQVGKWFWQVLQLAAAVERRSDGLVTPFILEALLDAGYDRSFDQLAGRDAAIPQAYNTAAAVHFAQTGAVTVMTPPMPTFNSVEMWPETHTLRLPAGWSLDFGGVAKGWAADKAMRKLQLYGPALVDAGGDIAISGTLDNGEPWPVGIDDPINPGESLGVLLLGRAGVATTGRDYRRWQKDGIDRHHIIDPRSGLPAANDVLSVTVVAPTVIEAEMAAKVALILGRDAGMDWLEAQAGMQGMLVMEDGALYYSSGFADYLSEAD